MDDHGNPIASFLSRQPVMVLDGGLATELEARGHRLRDSLWSARLLRDAPEAVERLHHDYLVAGADCVTTATYQASFAGFITAGCSDDEAAALLRRGVDLAITARDRFWNEAGNRRGRNRPLVAASVGPYGAFLADGSEYDGRYDIDGDALHTFHHRRWHLLAGSGADLLACETIPSAREATVLLDLLRETPGRHAWFSFTCRDGETLRDGTALGDVVAVCDREAGVAAVGVNCTAPRYVADLIRNARRHTTRPIVVYPNSGQEYDAAARDWRAGREPVAFVESAVEWVRLGARGVGGCCRIGPAEIAALRAEIIGTSS